MPTRDQPARSRRNAASVAHVSSIDALTCSSTRPSAVEPNSIRERNSRPSNQTRIVTTHVERSSTSTESVLRRSSKRLGDVTGGARSVVGSGTRVRLLNGFDVSVDGRTLALTLNAQRLVAFLALRERPQSRSSVAGTLWIDSSDRRASANLRTALWKLRTVRHALIDVRGNLIGLAPDVVVDFTLLVHGARRLLRRPPDVSSSALDDSGLDVDLFVGDLLPEWDEDWIMFERERLRQLRLHAVEALSRQLTDAGRYAEAVDAGLAAVAADALRESAHRVLIEAYLGEGNVADARRQFEQFRVVLWDSLRLDPSVELSRLVGVAAPSQAGD